MGFDMGAVADELRVAGHFPEGDDERQAEEDRGAEHREHGGVVEIPAGGAGQTMQPQEEIHAQGVLGR